MSEELFKLTGKQRKTNLPFDLNKVNIKNGNLEFKGKGVSITLLHFNLFSFNRKKELAFKLNSPHLKVVFRVGKKNVKLEGGVNSEFVKEKNRIKINKFLWKTENLFFNGNGGINAGGFSIIRVYWEGNPEKIIYPVLGKISPSGFMNGTINYIRDSEKNITITGNFRNNSFFSNGEELENLNGNLSWSNRSGKIRSKMGFNWKNINTVLNLESKRGKTNVYLSNIATSKILKIIKVYSSIPMGGIVEKGVINIDHGDLSSEILLKKNVISDKELNVSGKIKIDYNFKTKFVKFISKGLKSEFGSVTSLLGEYDKKKKKLKVSVKGRVDELKGINLYTTKYGKLNLSSWNFKGGRGNISVNYKAEGSDSILESSFDISGFTSGNVPIGRMTGNISGKNGLIKGFFSIKGNNFSGDFSLKKDDDKFKINMDKVLGESSDVMKILDIGLDLKGDMKGEFEYINVKNSDFPIIKGKFSGGKIFFYGYPFSDISGKLYIEDDININNLKFKYHDGSGNTQFLINTHKQYFQIKGNVSGINISDMNSYFKGDGNISFEGKGAFNTSPIKVLYNLKNVHYYDDKSFNIKGTASINTDFSSFMIKSSGKADNGENISDFFLNLNYIDDKYSGGFKANISDINMVMPWNNNSGILVVNGEIESGKDSGLHYRGIADIKGKYLSFPGFPHTLDNFKGLFLFKDSSFTLRSMSGYIGGGPVTGNGLIDFRDSSVNRFLLTLTGKNMEIYPMDRAQIKLDADIALRKSGEKFIIEGNLNFLSALWEREVDEGISFYSGSSSSGSGSKFLDNLEFNLRMTGKENIKIQNSFFTGNCKVDLRLTGDKNFPVLSGYIRSNEGKIHISSRDFDLIRAKILFNNPIVINPSISVEAETFIKSYRIKFLLNGLAYDLRPEFSSSPPMPTQDIIALISLGELFKRPVSTNISSEVGTTGLITSALTEKIQNRVKKLFGIDILKLDPDPTRSSLEGISRITIGKSFSKDFMVVYSTDISRSTRDVYFFQYRVTPSISLIGKRNEDGRLSLDVRFRKRY